jgi:hypothetical protein
MTVGRADVSVEAQFHVYVGWGQYRGVAIFGMGGKRG